MGLSRAEMDRLGRDERAARLASVAADFRRAGAHYTIESVAELIPVLDAIERRPGRDPD
jgi:phosphonoacetaldehyde hydrolase